MSRNSTLHRAQPADKDLVSKSSDSPAEGAEPNEPVTSKPHPISKAIEDYLRTLRDTIQTSQLVLPHISNWLIEEIKRTEASIQNYIPGFPNLEEEISFYPKSTRETVDFTKLIKKYRDLSHNRAPQTTAKSLFMQLFAEFDAYTGMLLKGIYQKNDILLKGISREISLSSLLEFDDLASVKESLLDKEIDSFRRDSYIEQFLTLEKKFSLPLRKFQEWPEFVEISQRRNLFTHNGGIVNEQYLLVCEREGVKFDQKPKIGTQLRLPAQYFFRSIILLMKIGVMLGFTLWNKIFPKEETTIHESYNNMLYGCLENDLHNLVFMLMDFSLSEAMKRNISEINLRIRIVNTAIGLKQAGKSDEAQKLINSIDWTASYRDFKLAVAVLNDDFNEAILIMEGIGKTGELVKQSSYHEWPLFYKFREIPNFYSTYEKIYGEKFKQDIPSPIPPSIGLNGDCQEAGLGAEEASKQGDVPLKPRVSKHVESTKQSKKKPAPENKQVAKPKPTSMPPRGAKKP